MDKIIIAGDFVPKGRVLDLFKKGEYDPVLGEVKFIVKNADYAIVNLEAPLTNGELTPIVKNGPNLNAPIQTLEAIEYAGFKCVTLANNHFLDQGEKGCLTTINECDAQKIDYVGAGRNLLEASRTLYKEIKGTIYAFINCCEHEYSIATENAMGSNPINPIQQYYAILEAKKKAKYVIVITHGGIEFCQYPTLRMIEWYRFFVDAGADAVINHHQHCYSGFEIYKEKTIFYGIGNFCFDRENSREDLWNYGYLVQLEFSENNTSYTLFPYIQCGGTVGVKIINAEEVYGEIEKISEIISDKCKLQCCLDEFMVTHDMNYDAIFLPYNNNFLMALYRRGWLPSFFNRNKWSRMRDLLCCESHNERFKSYIMKKYNELF